MNCNCQHPCATRCYSMQTGKTFKGLQQSCNCKCHRDERNENRVKAVVLRDGPMTAEAIHRKLSDLPMPSLQRCLVNLGLRGTVEIAGIKSRKTLWVMATK